MRLTLVLANLSEFSLHENAGSLGQIGCQLAVTQITIEICQLMHQLIDHPTSHNRINSTVKPDSTTTSK